MMILHLSRAPQKKALNGDGKAALQVGNVLVKCQPTTAQYRNDRDPQVAFENQLASLKGPEWALDRMLTRFALTQHAAAQDGIITGTADASKIQIAQADIDRAAATGDPMTALRAMKLRSAAAKRALCANMCK